MKHVRYPSLIFVLIFQLAFPAWGSGTESSLYKEASEEIARRIRVLEDHGLEIREREGGKLQVSLFPLTAWISHPSPLSTTLEIYSQDRLVSAIALEWKAEMTIETAAAQVAAAMEKIHQDLEQKLAVKDSSLRNVFRQLFGIPSAHAGPEVLTLWAIAGVFTGLTVLSAGAFVASLGISEGQNHAFQRWIPQVLLERKCITLMMSLSRRPSYRVRRRSPWRLWPVWCK